MIEIPIMLSIATVREAIMDTELIMLNVFIPILILFKLKIHLNTKVQKLLLYTKNYNFKVVVLRDIPYS